MNRTELKKHIEETYAADSDFPWRRSPANEVFRHSSNRKWFALVMEVPREKLGLQGSAPLTVVNVKSDPILIGSFLSHEGFFPAYHMSKDRWITIALDGSAPDEEIKMLLDLSFRLTAANVKKRKVSADA